MGTSHTSSGHDSMSHLCPNAAFECASSCFDRFRPFRTLFAEQHEARRSVPVDFPPSRPAVDMGQSRCRRQSPYLFPQLSAYV